MPKVHPVELHSVSAPAPTLESVADVTLLDTLAAMTPEQRLRWNDRVLTTILELRHGFAAAEPHHPARPAGGERE